MFNNEHLNLLELLPMKQEKTPIDLLIDRIDIDSH